MIGSLLAVLFLCRDIAHREHLRTTSYAQHMALQAFYEEIVDLADSLAEAYQGRNGVISVIPFMPAGSPGNIIDTLGQYLKWLEENRYDAVPKTDTALQNIIDEIVALYLTTLYKLRTLK